MRLKWTKSKENHTKITRLYFQNLVLLLAKIRYFFAIIQNIGDGIQIQVYNMNSEI